MTEWLCTSRWPVRLLRQKLAKRLGMARHRTDVAAIQATREAAPADAEADRDGSGDDSGGSSSGSSDGDEEAEYSKYNGANFRVDDHNTKRPHCHPSTMYSRRTFERAALAEA